jgi:hypothetical protein
MNPFTPKFADMPPTIPVFPLTGVLLLPGGSLPLNIFEPRYLQMVADALSSPSRLIGMIQPRDFGQGTQPRPDLQDIGCAGRITSFEETEDGRYLITLSGVCRFRLKEELGVTTPYRQITADWSGFSADFEEASCDHICKDKLKSLLKAYFEQQGMSCEWSKVDEAPKERLVRCLSMICPFGPAEKQALLEAETQEKRADLLFQLLEFSLASAPKSEDGATRH